MPTSLSSHKTIRKQEWTSRLIKPSTRAERKKEFLRHELLEGLMMEQMKMSSKFFYDTNGSKLFEWITKLPEYYPTRTEKSILKQYGQQLFGHLSHIDLVELGSGDCSKISLILSAIPSKQRETIIYRPIDFSQSALDQSQLQLLKVLPELKVEPLVADFTKLQALPNGQPRVICFLGSTIGNFDLHESQLLLQQIADIMNTGDQLIIGLDLVKDTETLESAYNDSQRITEAFNKNILRSCNNILHSNFHPPAFEHLAFFNHEKSRIEMHLKALSDLFVKSPYLNGQIMIQKGETIHTENSHKYTIPMIEELADSIRLNIKNIFTDQKQWFSLVQMVK
ncbi:L-histidine N(alpha)-methyltransferase [Carboxylicivirga sp. M1479]|uniref:L-histidine N(alpha)-methyltransferase n=1 Tax=Carboxylicivirga sp. M1479 TaxID=2594476 RepID=UPI0011778516|nr:L-histidine N(alpha)-methyltransferase [Carboxylicivirga sp. M1479]TRX66008.1 L-histidine N(alpha)-methyltransferase [Carboxylicivirga sp. M1479]